MSLLSETRFGLALLNQAPVNESLVISPLSISLALSLVHAGADGTSKEEIRKALAQDGTDEELVAHYKGLSAALLKESDVIVRIANRLFIREGFSINPSYIENIGKHFAAKAESLQFENGDASAKVVNGFVNESTAGMIKELVDATTFKDAVALLINALYLDAEWQHKFSEHLTEEDDFHVKDGVKKKIKYLNQNNVHRLYTETDEVQVLSLNYKDEDYKFTVVLPKEKNGLRAVRAGLTAEKLQGFFNDVKDIFINVSIPKFKIEKETDLNEVLKNLGIQQIFQDDAHLDGIAANVRVSDVKHKAVIEVDANGTKAGAATLVGVEERSGMFCLEEPLTFKADHPFLFFVSYKGSTIFSGQYSE